MSSAPVYDLTNKLLGVIIVEVPYSRIDVFYLSGMVWVIQVRFIL